MRLNNTTMKLCVMSEYSITFLLIMFSERDDSHLLPGDQNEDSLHLTSPSSKGEPENPNGFQPLPDGDQLAVQPPTSGIGGLQHLRNLLDGRYFHFALYWKASKTVTGLFIIYE